MRPDIGKIVDADAGASCATAHRLAHHSLVPAKRPRTTSSVTMQSDVHRTPHTHGPLPLAMATAFATTVPGARDIEL